MAISLLPNYLSPEVVGRPQSRKTAERISEPIFSVEKLHSPSYGTVNYAAQLQYVKCNTSVYLS